MKIILITGTKGKTSLALMLNSVFLSMKKTVLCISSEGIIENGKNIKDNEYFLKKFETSANVVALKEVSQKKASQFEYIILESSYSANKKISTSFAKNNVDLAILTNVYWDHIDGKKIKNQKELFDKKLELIKNLKPGGTALVYTGDKKDSLSHKAISAIKKKREDVSVFSFREGKRTPIKNSPQTYLITNGFIYHSNKKILDISLLKLPFKEYSTPIRLNLTALTAAMISLNINPSILISNAINLSVPGRLNVFSKNGYFIVLDYAHEIKSLSLAATLLRKEFKNKKIIAIIRFSYYRKIETIKKMTAEIASLFDYYIIYDKAVSRPSLRKIFTYNKQAGSVAKTMQKVILEKGASADVINDEITAIKKSIRNLKKDEVLYIIGDQIQKDISVIKSELDKK